MHFLRNYPEAIPIKINKAQPHSSTAIFHFTAKENKNTIIQGTGLDGMSLDI